MSNLSLGTWSLIVGGIAALGLAAWILIKRKFICNVLRTIPRDVKALRRLIKMVFDLRYLQRNNYTISKAFDDVVKKDPKKVVLYFEDQQWTAEKLQKYSHKVANYFQQQGFKKGDTVAIFMENNVEYMAYWLGLSRIGCTTSLVNFNLRLQPLKHCFEAVNCKAIIYNPELTSALEEVIELGGLAGTPLFCVGYDGKKHLESFSDMNEVLKNVSDEPPKVIDPVGFVDTLFYIYTSGTTGLPKAAIIKHSRFFMAAVGNYYMFGLQNKDILYTSLPLYHGSGVMLGGGTMLCYGVSQVVRKKFSASNFWNDCRRYNVTAAQYIGEICRYLMAQAPSPLDKQHKVRVMFGNGLKAEIWPDFVERFGVRQICELYGATEGNCNMVNIDGTVGAVGFLPLMFGCIVPLRLIKVDENTGEPLRNKKGFVIQCDFNEPGELIGRIQKNHPIRDFEGYADKNSSKDKVLHNAFRNGDAWFRSGDILMRDDLGYFYFKDRKGDTFRWKGENCSTAEVESVISSTCGLNDAVVFGVTLEGYEGRAGMAVISNPEDTLNLEIFAVAISKALPNYARPVFVRVAKKLDMTGTYKLKKLDYQKVGYDITKTDDPIFFFNGKQYISVDKTLYEDIRSGKIRV